MKKKILIVIIAFVLVINVCACTKKEAAETPESPTAAPTEAPSPEPTEEAKNEPDESEESPAIEDPMLEFFEGGGLVFAETADDMQANGGSEFGDISKKQMGDGGYEFTFVPNVNEHMPLITRLDEFEGASPLGGQAVFVRFKTSTAGIYMSFLGDNDFGVYFGDEGQPLVFTYTENSPFPFEGDIKLETGKWYNLLMAMDVSGTFNCIIYQDDQSESPSTAAVALGETQSGAGYKDQSWQFEVATHEEGAVTVEHYNVYTYTAFAGG